MESQALVSIIMCVYNTNQEFLVEAVRSILNQTYRCFEFLIVDDNSDADLFGDIIFKDRRITIFKNANNRGPSYSRNRALAASKGKYIAIMDSDDISLPTRIEEQVDFLEKNYSFLAVGTWFQHFGFKNNIVRRNIDDNEYFRCCLLFGNSPTILNSSVMIRKSALIDNDIAYDEELRIGEDYKMWVELSQVGSITNLKKVLVKYRIHDKQVTKDNSRNRQSLRYDAKVKIMQLDCISKEFTDDEKVLFSLYFGDKKVNAVKYFKLLQKILELNKKSLFFDQHKLEIRVNEQWENKLLRTNNPFKILSSFLKIKSERMHIIHIKFRQLKHKFARKK